MIHQAGAKLFYLPSYSPDLNSTEKLWAKVKAFLRKRRALTPEALQRRDRLRLPVLHLLIAETGLQKLVVYLLLEDALEWKCGISGLPIQTSAPSPEPAHRGRAESYPEYAAKESHAWNDRTVAAASQTGLYPLPGKPVPSYAQTGDIPADKGQNALQAKTIRADAVSRPACAGGYESGTAEMPGKSGRTVISVYSD